MMAVGFFKHFVVSKGMLPNRFPDDGSAPTENDYNNADGTVWYCFFVLLRGRNACSGSKR